MKKINAILDKGDSATIADLQELRRLGCTILRGKVAVGGYHPAKDGGGYSEELVATPEGHEAFQIWTGCPVIHGLVAIIPTEA